MTYSTPLKRASGSLLPVLMVMLALTVCGPAPKPEQHIVFDHFPDGTALTSDTILQGDEFEEAGILLAPAPESDYCAQTDATALRGPGRYAGTPFYFLTTAMSDDIDMCNGIPVEIRFIEPVRWVRLVFVGASQPYTLKAYGLDDELLGSAEQTAVFGGDPVEVAFESDQSDITRITFGRQLALTAVKEIYFQP